MAGEGLGKGGREHAGGRDCARMAATGPWGEGGSRTGSWQPYVKNYAPSLPCDCGDRAAALWLDW